MSKHFHDGDAVGVMRRERLGGDCAKHLWNQRVVQLGQDRVEVIECLDRVFDDSFFRRKRHSGSLKIRQTRSPFLKPQVDRIQTPAGGDVPDVPNLPRGTKVPQGRRLLNQNLSEVVVPPRNVPEVRVVQTAAKLVL
jgi:hypothetical protein